MLRRLIQKHADRTDSERAQQILADWNATKREFCVLRPEPPTLAPEPAEEAAQVPTPAVPGT